MNTDRTKNYGPIMDKQSKEQTNQLRKHLGWHLNDVKLNKLRIKMNRNMNGIPMMSNLGNK